MDFGFWPAVFDRGCGSLAAVDDDNERGWDAFEEALVVMDGFVFAPVPGDDVVECCCHDQAAACGVGAVEEDLVVNPACMPDGGIWDVD